MMCDYLYFTYCDSRFKLVYIKLMISKKEKRKC